MVHRWLAVGAVLLCSTGAAYSQALMPEQDGRADDSLELVLRPGYQLVRDEVSDVIDRVREKYSLAGLSIAVVEGKDLAWAEGFGYADLERARPAGPGTVYRVGSVSKVLTAMAIMALDETDALDVEQPLTAYLPEFRVRSRFNRAADPITLRMLLSHHSGLPTDILRGMWSDARFTSVLADLRQEYVAYPPGVAYNYSNIAYSLLGQVIERSAGMRYETAIQQRFLQPLGMRHTAFGTPPADGSMAIGYKRGKAQTLLPIRDTPAFGMTSSALDLARLVQFVFADGSVSDRALLMPGTVYEMMEVQDADQILNTDVSNGLGWFVEKDTVMGGGYVIRHGGNTINYASEMLLLPEQRLGVVVLSNTAGSRPIVKKLAEAIAERVLDYRESDMPAAHGSLLASLPDTVELRPGDQVAGRFATDLGLLALEPDAARLCNCSTGENLDLVPYPDGWFSLSQDAAATLPPAQRGLAKVRLTTRQVDDRDLMFAERDGREFLLGERIDNLDVPQVWQERCGDYVIMNDDPGFPVKDARLFMRDGSLGLAYRLPGLSDAMVVAPLRVVSNDTAVILGLSRLRGETILVEQTPSGERLRYSGYVGRRVE